MQFVIIFALIVAIFAVTFALQNPNTVTLTFFVWHFEAPLALFLLIAVAIGAILISILTIPGWWKNKRAEKRHHKEIVEMEDNLAKYRTDLIDAQNSNKDLRQKVEAVEEAKVRLEKAQSQAESELKDLHTSLGNAELSASDAEQARSEAVAVRDSMDKALKDLQQKLDAAQTTANEAKELAMTKKSETKEPTDIEELNMLDGNSEDVEKASKDLNTSGESGADHETEATGSDNETVEGKTENPDDQKTEEAPKKHSWF